MLGRDEKMQPGFVDFPNFAQGFGFGFAGREAISEAREFSKTHQVGFCQGCDTGVVFLLWTPQKSGWELKKRMPDSAFFLFANVRPPPFLSRQYLY